MCLILAMVYHPHLHNPYLLKPTSTHGIEMTEEIEGPLYLTQRRKWVSTGEKIINIWHKYKSMQKINLVCETDIGSFGG